MKTFEPSPPLLHIADMSRRKARRKDEDADRGVVEDVRFTDDKDNALLRVQVIEGATGHIQGSCKPLLFHEGPARSREFGYKYGQDTCAAECEVTRATVSVSHSNAIPCCVLCVHNTNSV